MAADERDEKPIQVFFQRHRHVDGFGLLVQALEHAEELRVVAHAAAETWQRIRIGGERTGDGTHQRLRGVEGAVLEAVSDDRLAGMHFAGVDDDQVVRRGDMALAFMREGLHAAFDDAEDEVVVGMGLEGVLHEPGPHKAQVVESEQCPRNPLVNALAQAGVSLRSALCRYDQFTPAASG